MPITVEIDDPLAAILKSRADSQEVTPGELITSLLGDCLAKSEFQEQNERRVTLIRKSHRGGLNQAEAQELQSLQDLADKELEEHDSQLHDYLQTLREEAGAA